MKWYQNSFRRNLIDMHISDMDKSFLNEFSSEAYAQALEKAKVDTAIIYTGSCLGINYFDSRFGHKHSNLKDRNIVAETIEACKKRNMKIVLYFNIWSRWAYDNHPDWRMKNVDGKGYQVDMGQIYGQCCPNTPYFNYVKEMITDLLTQYKCEGLWIDMIGWNHSICYCDSCKKRFKEETGFDIPEIIDWNDKKFLLFKKKREEWFLSMAKMITVTARELQPEITVTQQCASWSLGWIGACTQEFFNQSDYLAGDFYGNCYTQSVICKYLANITTHKPIEYMVSRCCNLTEHTLNKPITELTAERYSALAHNASFVFIDAIDPSGTIDSRIFEEMGLIFSNSEKYEKNIDINAKLMSDVGIILQQSSLVNIYENGKNIRNASSASGILSNIYNIAEILIDNNITFDILTADSLDRMTEKKVLIISDTAMLTASETENIKTYVSQGGNLYASGVTSLYNDTVGNLNDFSLSEVFGVNRIGEEPGNYHYIVPECETTEFFNSFNSFDRKYPMPHTGRFQKVRLNRGKSVAVLGNCYYDKVNDIYEYASAISNPPDKITDKPVIVQNKYGYGNVIYSAACFEANKLQAVQDVFVNIIKSMIASPITISDAPRSAEILVYKGDNKLYINLLNIQSKLPPIPLFNTTLKINSSLMPNAEIFQIFDISEDKLIPFALKDDYIIFNCNKTEYYNSFIIQFK